MYQEEYKRWLEADLEDVFMSLVGDKNGQYESH